MSGVGEAVKTASDIYILYWSAQGSNPGPLLIPPPYQCTPLESPTWKLSFHFLASVVLAVEDIWRVNPQRLDFSFSFFLPFYLSNKLNKKIKSLRKKH